MEAQNARAAGVAVDSDVAALIERLGLAPHPEGGFFAETYRSPRNAGDRAVSTAIYFLITAANPSRLHRVTRGDEIWHFYLGDPLEMLQLDPEGESRTIAIGTNIEKGERPQVLVPAGVWQGVAVKSGGRYALVGATVTPGFDFADFELGDRDRLVAAYPQCADSIRALT
jgi:predicted cupin superfamily sugar epimerase